MIDISGILDDVVHQFRDPLAFFRELVQNAIDAGTGEVAIDLTYDDGAMTATVRDFGSGMDREVIETQLCRLFSSAKYEDLTAIGRFGIGFVSVYGVDPDFVCVDTGRHGESWRVIFLPDRTYELYELAHPVEGTTVSVVKTMSPDEFEDFEDRARTVVRRWCRHVRTPVLFDGVDQREPFELSAPVAVEFSEQGTRIVAGLVPEPRPLCGYFNRGLMLKEQEGGPWPHFAFKIDSRYLDHTLTRDDLLRDRNYRKGIDILERFATRELPDALLRALEEAPPVDGRSDLYDILCGLERHAPITVKGWRERPIFHGPGEPLTVEQMERSHRDAELWLATEEDALARSVQSLGHRVVIVDDPGSIGALLGIEPRLLRDHWFELDATSLPKATEAALAAAMAGAGFSPSSLAKSRLDEAGKTIATTVDELDVPVRRVRLKEPLRLDGEHLVFNTSHPLVAAALHARPSTGAALLATALVPERAEDFCATLAERLHG